MNLRERRWRERVADMVAKLDAKMAETEDWEAKARLSVLRQRLAGGLGAEEGYSSTSQLRSRAAEDFAAAAKVLGLDEKPLSVPRGGHPTELVRRDFDSYRKAKLKYGDRA